MRYREKVLRDLEELGIYPQKGWTLSKIGGFTSITRRKSLFDWHPLSEIKEHP
ncbi:MAG: hypothetical protein WCC94_07135 [Candidatus Bathyarchaeia archaeon]